MVVAELNADARREDFSLETYRYLETLMNEIRRRVMDEAAASAFRADTSSLVVPVSRLHIDQAFAAVLGNPESLLKLVQR